MNTRRFLTGFAVVLSLTGFSPSATFAADTTNQPAAGKKFTYVIVHGAWGGAYAWKHVAQSLTTNGNTVYRPTLTGQGERSHLASTNIDLDMHIQDIVNVILWEDLHDVVLVGHSYGGMVITGVADRVPDRIKHMIYVDALLPEDGESANAILAERLKMPVKNGYTIAPWVKNNKPPPHDVSMSAKTFSEPISLKHQGVAGKLPATFILTVDKGQTREQDDFYPFYQRAKARGWPTWTMEGDHGIEWSHPQELVELLEKAP